MSSRSFSLFLVLIGLCAMAREASLYDHSVESITGEKTTLGEHKGKVLLIVNVASKCGLTKQYTQLQKLHETYAARGLVVLGFPCNQFGKQEPGTLAEIQEFCVRNFSVAFPLYAKIEVNGENAHPLYKQLKATGGPEAIRWNFEKFLVGTDGVVLKRFAPHQAPNNAAIIAALEAALPMPVGQK